MIFFLLFLLQLGVHGAITTVTVDDSDPSFTYIPDGRWNVNGQCPGCWAQPDPSSLYLRTWHENTRTHDDLPVNVTYSFKGVGISVYAALWDTPTPSAADTNLTFTIDGVASGEYKRASSRTSERWTYDENIFSTTNLANQAHTLVINMDPNTYFLLDRVEVQFDDDVPANTATSEAPVDSSTVSQTPALPSSTLTSPITTTTTSSPARLPGDGISSRDTSTLRSTSSTTSSPAPSSSLSGSQSQRPESINIPAIAGGVGGGTVVVCLVILGIIILCRRKRRSRFPLRGDAILLQRSKLHRIPSSIPDEKYLELAPKVSRERVHRDFKFLQMESLCDLSQLGISREWVSTVSNDTIILTNPNFSKSDTHAGSQAIIFDIPSRTKQRILQSSQDADSFVFAHSLSPDKKLLVRWIKKRSSSTDCVIEVADFPVNHLYRRLTSQLHCDIWDARASKWINDNTIVIPDSRSRTITRWSITADRLEPTIIRPLAEITRHKSLAFYTTAGEKWLVTNGWTAGLYGATGVIEARRYDGSRSRMITGVACCTTEVAFYDERRTLLVVADLEADKLILKVEQLEQSPESGPFQPVRTSVDLHVSGDCPQMVMVLQHLPIVVVSTIKGSLYFFELYFGSYLYSQSLSSEEVWCGSADDQSILVHSPNKGSIERVSVNTNDLIGFVRNVLKNDVLASSIAMRAGLPGAEDVAWADMHGEYRNFSEIDMV